MSEKIWKPVRPDVSIAEGGIMDLDVSKGPKAERCTRITMDVTDIALAQMAEHELPYIVRDMAKSIVARDHHKIVQAFEEVISDREFMEHEIGRALRAEMAAHIKRRLPEEGPKSP